MQMRHTFLKNDDRVINPPGKQKVCLMKGMKQPCAKRHLRSTVHVALSLSKAYLGGGDICFALKSHTYTHIHTEETGLWYCIFNDCSNNRRCAISHQNRGNVDHARCPAAASARPKSSRAFLRFLHKAASIVNTNERVSPRKVPLEC